MRILRQLRVLFPILVAFPAFVHAQTRTDAQNDGFAGPVKSVSTSAVASGLKWQQSAGVAWVEPIFCFDCEYDFDGTKIKSGQTVDSGFIGENIRLVRDPDGHLTDRFIADATTGEILSHEIMGPFGKTQVIVYDGESIKWQQTFTYDQYGHMSDWRTFDPAGRQVGRTFTSTDKNGIITERSAWGKDGEIEWRHTFDPETGVDHFATYDALGNTNLTWILADEKVVSYWELPASSSRFGENFSTSTRSGAMKCFACHSDGVCQVSFVHREYVDAEKRNLRSLEWRDAQGNLRSAVYYDYQVDSFNNWTQRKVWVWTPELGQRSLLETDSRVITYWEK